MVSIKPVRESPYTNIRDPEGTTNSISSPPLTKGAVDMHRMATQQTQFSTTAGWSNCIVPGKGLALDQLPAEWQTKLGVLTENDDDENSRFITLHTLANAAKRQAAATTVRSDGKIDVSGFPDHLHAALNAFDIDCNGMVDSAGLQHAAVMYTESKNSQKKLFHAMVLLFIIVVLVCGVTGVLTYVIAEQTKEVNTNGASTQGGQVVLTASGGSADGMPVATTTPELTIPLGAILHVRELWDHLSEVKMDIGDHHFRFTVSSVDVQNYAQPDASAVLYTTNGDMINVTNVMDAQLVKQDGTVHPICALCAACSGFNVVRTTAVDAGLKGFCVAKKMREQNLALSPTCAAARGQSGHHQRRATPQRSWDCFLEFMLFGLDC